MRTYLVEDDPLKAEELSTFLRTTFPSMFIELFGSFQSGLRAVQSASPDLLLLDMTLPTYDRAPMRREGRSRPLGGYDLMRKMKFHGVGCKVIVVTGLDNFGDGDDLITFDEITARCAREFPNFFVGAVQFQQSETDWMRSLESLIQSTMRSE